MNWWKWVLGLITFLMWAPASDSGAQQTEAHGPAVATTHNQGPAMAWLWFVTPYHWMLSIDKRSKCKMLPTIERWLDFAVEASAESWVTDCVSSESRPLRKIWKFQWKDCYKRLSLVSFISLLLAQDGECPGSLLIAVINHWSKTAWRSVLVRAL